MREIKIGLCDAIHLIREKLAEGGEVLFSPKGTSMLPTLKEGRDRVVLSAPPKKLKKYDIALYLRENGQYVLHRAVVVGDSYTFLGDNQFIRECGIKDSQIIAVCTATVRGGKRIPLDTRFCRMRAAFRYHTRHLRKAVRAILHSVRSIFK